MAIALGAASIEKHMTCAHNIELVDHWSALTPDEFATFVEIVRELEPALGSASSELSANELAYRLKALKVVVATKPLTAGDVISQSDVALKRAPETSSKAILRLDDVIGRRMNTDLNTDEPFLEGSFS
jgi:N,N'-diacetyllegionaminate synthase